MTRLVAALLVVAVSLAFAAAQEREPGVRFPLGGAAVNLPFEVTQAEGKTTWKVRGRGTVRVEDLIGGLTNAHNLRVTYSARAAEIAKGTVPYVGSDAGLLVAHAELPDYASDLLASLDLTIVGHSTGVARVVRIGEAAAFARFVAAEDLGALPASEWVSVCLPVENTPAESLRGLLGNIRQEGTQIQMGGGSVVVFAQAAQARSAARMVAELDRPALPQDGKVVRSYELPAGMQAAAVANALMALFNEPRATVQDAASGWKLEQGPGARVTVTTAGRTDRVMVRASTADHVEVEAAIAAME